MPVLVGRTLVVALRPCRRSCRRYRRSLALRRLMVLTYGLEYLQGQRRARVLVVRAVPVLKRSLGC